MNYSTNGQQPQTQGETKICKYCGKEIPESAKVCPYCRKKQSHTVRNVILIVLGIVILLVLLFSCMGGGGDDTTSDSGTNSNAVVTDTQEEEDTGTTDQNYTVGSTFTDGDISVTLDSVNQVTQGQFSTPPEGYVYLILNWTITNNGSEEYVDMVQFNGYVDSSAVNRSFHTDVAPQSVTGGETLIAGSSLSGVTLYEVPAGWTQFQERVQIEALSDQSVTYTITPNEVS